MRWMLSGLMLALAACMQAPQDDPSATHTCTTAPNGMVECTEIN